MVFSFMGMLLSIFTVFFMMTVYGYNCNDPLYGYNICNNRCSFCASYYNLNNNFCYNTVGCSLGYSCTNNNQWDPEFIVLFIFMIVIVIVFVSNFASSINFYIRIMKIMKMVERYEKYRKRKNIGENISQFYEDYEHKSYFNYDKTKHDKMEEAIMDYLSKSNPNRNFADFFVGLY